tara:strand:+ start:75781 stop:75957 length:177 start_codon:yes stop_codon:yes gene_type:complete
MMSLILSDIDQFDHKENQQVLIIRNLMSQAQQDQNTIGQALKRFDMRARQILTGNFTN